MGRKGIAETRRAPHMERYVSLERVPRSRPVRYVVELKVENQSFRIGDVWSRAEALWMRNMLCIALDVLSKQQIAAFIANFPRTRAPANA